MRKPQPFTIGTRLSIPKCPDISTSGPGGDGASKPWPVSDRLCQYLDAPPSPPRGAAHCHSPVACMTDGDHLTPGSLVRSIKKIALSRHTDGATLRGGTAAMSPRLLTKTSHGNCNNNNSRGLRHLIAGTADLPRDPRMIIGAAECHKTAKCPGSLYDLSTCDSGRTAPSAGNLVIGAGRASRAPPDITQLSREIKQAEIWVRCKLQDLTDGGDTCSPLLIQRDIQDYEGTVLQLSQMVDQVSRAQTPGAASVRSQIQTLRDQWQLLKKMAANQNCAVGGATTLLEFNKKADELEMWMREQEEIPPLHVILDQNLDKVQITRKILDLKQEQIWYCSLQENINILAQKLEKHGRPESRATSTRRKHLNRMWQRLQTSLHEHQQSLQLALEAASLGHQADAILRSIEKSRGAVAAASADEDCGSRDLRDIAGQIMMLDVTVSQVSKLHPLLSSRALHKHRQVKERWARLQKTLRTEKTSRSAPSTRETGDSLTPDSLEKISVGNQEQSLRGSVVPVCQLEKTNDGNFTALSALPDPQRQTRSQVSSQHPTDAKRLVTSEPETGYNAENGHQPPGPPETPEVRPLLQELSSTCQWLQGVELLLSEPAAMRSPQLIRKDLKHVSLLEREVRARGAALHGLRGNARKCRKTKWTLTEEVEEKVQEVQERFQTLQDALRRRVSDLRDTLVLSEFMKVVQMEEERKKETIQMSTRSSTQSDPSVPSADRTATFTPLEELQEAVEILNDAVKERERALAATRETVELETKVLALSQMMAAAGSKLRDVRAQLQEAEKEFVSVKRETELRDLGEMVSQQQQVETDMSGEIGPEVRQLQDLQGLYPAWSLSASRGIEDTQRMWTDLQTLFKENQARLQRTERLREFFLCYLGMISWTEVTRGRILSESTRGRLSPAQREELERTMEGKLKEFELLAGIGWKLIGEDHILAHTIRERMEEVQGLLSWLLMRWRCQKHKRIMGNQTNKMKTSEATNNMDTPKITPSSAILEEFECPEDEDATAHPAPKGPILRRYRRRALSPILFQSPSCRTPMGANVEEGIPMTEDSPRRCTKGPLWLEPKNIPTGSVTPEPQEEELVMVSTYLNMNEEAQGTYHSLTVPCVSKTVPSSGHDSLLPTCESSSGALPKIRSNLFFRSLRRKEKAQRCTIQGIMGLYTDITPNAKDTHRYQTSTWPPKQEKNLTTPGTNMELETFLNYIQNPLSKDIDAECGSGAKKQKLKSLNSSAHVMPSSCSSITVGSVLTLQIPKEHHILDNIQDTITVISSDNSGNDQHLYSKEKPNSTANEIVTEEQSSIPGDDTRRSGTRAWLEALTSSSGYCRQNIHGYGKSVTNSQEALDDFIENFEIDRLSPIVLRHLDPDWDTHEDALNSSMSLQGTAQNCDISYSQCQNRGAATTTSLVLQETERDATICPVLQETEEYNTTSSPKPQKTGGANILSTLLQEKIVASTSYTIPQQAGRTITSYTIPQGTGGATTSSTVLRDTGESYCVQKHSDGQPASKLFTDCILHTYEPSQNLHDPYSPIETPPDKWIFNKNSSLSEVLHPDHEFLQNDDEELEGIWNNAKKAPLICPAQASHNMASKEMMGHSRSPVKQESYREPHGQVVMGAEKNVLVATFALPASSMLSTESVREDRPNTWKENSQSRIPAPTTCYLEKISEGRSRLTPQTSSMETIEKTSISKLSRKLDFHLMEGPLEKKHVLQVGARKASSRTWGTFYAVLVRRTLCFYHDHKHSTKSSASAPPLHLTGAVCTPESDYTKRDNCFRLRLLDGSEYLFRAPTPESLHQWVTKLRHNSGMEDADLLREAVLASDLSPRIRTRSLMPDLCQSVPARSTDLVLVASSPYWKEEENVTAAEIHKPNSHHLLPGRFTMPDNNSADPESNLTSRRRSQSFSSVVYQKMTSISGPQDSSSSFSVTLYIDDPLIPRGRCHSFSAPQGELLSRHTADLKPRNKSVFRKFFRKKE